MTDKNKKHKLFRFKIYIIGFVFVFFFGIVTVRSYQLQISGDSKLKTLAKSQYKTSVRENAKRGAIYDRNHEALALDALVASVAVHPHLIKDKKQAVKVLSNYTDVSRQKLTKKLSSSRKFEWIQRRIPLDLGKSLKGQKIHGIEVLTEYRRFYPNRDMAGQLLGSVGYDAKALGGIELDYDSYLRSDSQKKRAERDARGRLFSALEDHDHTHDLYLTIDKHIQNIADAALKEGAKKHRVKKGFAVVMDAETGEILAMANYPSFNPNLYWKYPQSVWNNHAVIDVFEPGSTFKSILIAAALDAGVVKPTDRFFCENGKYRVGRETIRDDHPQGWLTVTEILKVSSNIGVTKIAQKLGRKRFYDFLKKMRFGEKTEAGFMAEVSGSLKNHKTWKDIELSNIAFGQGLSVTGLQMAAAYSALVNGGHYVKPLLVKKIVSAAGQVMVENQATVSEDFLSQEVSKQMRDMMFSVTQTGGTATQAHISGYLSGGKTGTAQIFDVKSKEYHKEHYVSSFIGFAPLDNPRFVVYVVYDTPTKNGYYGGVVAGPVFEKIASRSLAYLGVVPDEKHLAKKEKKSPSRITKVKKTARSTKGMPDLTGKPLREVLRLAEQKGVKLSVQGSGFVIRQTPVAGSNHMQKKWGVELAFK